jgi:hypothetical protein
VSLLQVLRDPQPERLDEAIQLTVSSLAVRVDHRAPPPWYVEARTALDRASEARAAHELDRGWALVHRARELEVLAFAHAEVTAEATTLAAEVLDSAFRGWRKEAILDHLREVLAKDADGRWELPLQERRTWLVQALRTRSEGFSNQYRNLALLRRFQAILLLVAVGILACSLVGAAFANPEFERGAGEWWAAIGAALSGALGGIASALQRTTRRSGERIPERLGSLVAAMSRPVIGAIAGVTVFLAVRAGVTQTNEEQVAWLLFVSFGAGFSERLVVRDPREDAGDRRPGPGMLGTMGLGAPGRVAPALADLESGAEDTAGFAAAPVIDLRPVADPGRDDATVEGVGPGTGAREPDGRVGPVDGSGDPEQVGGAGRDGGAPPA